MTSRRTYSILLIITLLCSITANAQNYLGTDFWVGHIVNGGDQRPHSIKITATGDTACQVTVSHPATGWTQTSALTAGGQVTFQLPATALPEHYSMVDAKGYHVTSTASIQVSTLSGVLASSDATSLIPTRILGTRYIVLDYPADPNLAALSETGGTVTIVATEDNTTVSYTPPCALHTLPGDPPAPAAGTPTTHTLASAGQTVTLLANSANSSLSGMEITSDKPIAVFQGNQITHVPHSSSSADMMYHQSVPVELWGTAYGLVATAGRSVGDRVRVVADSACTVTLSDGTTFNLSARGVHEFDLPANSTRMLTATSPVSVGLCSKSSDYGGEAGDASLLMVPPADYGISHGRFVTYTTERIHTWYVVVVTDQPAGMTHNGNNIASRFQPIGTTGYSYARFTVGSGTHRLDHSNGTFNAWTYGVGNVQSYLYSIGQSYPLPVPDPCAMGNGQGTDFWATFLCNDDDPANAELSLVATGQRAADITVTNPVTGHTQTAHLNAGGMVKMTLPTATSMPSAQPDNKGYHITSTAPITLYGNNYIQGSWDFTQVLPTLALSHQYLVQNYPNNSDHPANIAIVATEDNTQLTMVLPCTVTGLSLPAGATYTVTLNSGQTLLLRANNGQNFSGMEVSSNCKPFALFQGCGAGRVGDNGYSSGRDHFMEQAVPLEMWGTEFVATATKDRTEGDRILVTAGDDNCLVTFNGINDNILARGQSCEFNLASNTTLHITTTQPAYACLYMTSYRNGGTNGDPGAASLPPVERWVERSDFMLVQCNNNPNSQYYIANPYINIIAESTAVGTLALDGAVIPAAQFSPIAGTPYSHARMHIAYGAHCLDAGGSGTFSARAYGLGRWVGFTYNIDMVMDCYERCIPETQRDTTEIYDTTCVGTLYEGHGFRFDASRCSPGTFHLWDSTVVADTVHCRVLHLLVLPTVETRLQHTIVAGDTLRFGDTLITLAGEYRFTYTAANGCDSVVVLEVGYEQVSFRASADGICPDDSVVLEATGPSTFRWASTPHDPSLDSQQGRNPIVVYPRTTTVYSLIDANGNPIASHTVGVEPPPALCIEGVPPYIDFDHPVIIMHDCSEGRQRTSWDFDDGAHFTGARMRRIVPYPLPDSVRATMTSCNRYGCCADTTLVLPTCTLSVWFPNVFTPDAASNNRFGCVTTHEVAEWEMDIYNRWGLLVWSTEEINQPWDGTKDGNPVKQEAYVYRWRLKDIHGNVRSGIGTVTLLR